MKESKITISNNVNILGDTGYQGLHKLNEKARTPYKGSKKKPLTKDEKKFNHRLSSKRTIVENVICLLKRFKIIADKYRNRRKRFSLRFNLIAGWHNYELLDF